MNAVLGAWLLIATGITFSVFFYDTEGMTLSRRLLGVLNTAAVSFGLVLIVWAVFAGPVSSYSEGICNDTADGYGLEHEWGFRTGCRVYLPTGQLVPIGIIRITSEGQITG